MRGTKLLLALLIAVGVSACEKKGAVCDTCSNNSDCDAGLTCEAFTGGNRACASASTRTCLLAARPEVQ